MFKIATEPKFTHTVRVMVPIDGGHAEQTMRVTFRVEDVDKLTGIQDEGGQRAVLQRVVSHVDDLVDDAEQPVPYSDDLRDKLIGVPFVRIAMFLAYIEAVTKARQGN